MKTQSPDTHPEIERIMFEAYRKMTVAEKLRRVEEMNQMLELLGRADVKRNHPDAGEREICLRIASRRIPPELMKKAFGWDVEKEGY